MLVTATGSQFGSVRNITRGTMEFTDTTKPSTESLEKPHKRLSKGHIQEKSSSGTLEGVISNG